MIQLFGRLLNRLWTLAIIVLLIFTLYAGYQRLNGINHPKFFGTGFGIVVSGSMEPNLPEGSFIVIREAADYEVGDIITYTSKQNISITHRINEIEGDKIIPKGDANNTSDPSITKDQIVGKVVFAFPLAYMFLPLVGVAFYCLLSCIFMKDEEKIDA